MRRVAVLLVGMLALVPQVAWACPSCFGQSDAPMAKAMQAGIVLMLVVVVMVLGCFAAFIVYLNRRARAAAATEGAAARASYVSVDPHEGTA